MRKLFITDLDHTFLNSNQTVTSFSREVWNRKAKEMTLSIATARSFSKTEYFFKGLELNAPLILLDGAMVVTPNKEIIEIKTLDKRVGDMVIDIGREFNIEPFIIAIEDYKELKESFLLPPNMNYYQDKLIKSNYSKDTRLVYTKNIEGKKDTLKIVYMGEESILRPLSLKIKEILKDEIEVKLSPENYMGCYFLTLLHPLGDKAHALRVVSSYLNIPLKDTTVFGDSLNDIEMFKIAGTSIAVSNALDEVKREAKIILPHSNDEDGVAKYLLKL